jgi:membrane protein
LTLCYYEPETRSLRRRLGLALALVLGGALLLGAVIAGAGVVSRALDGSADVIRAVAQVLVWLALAALMVPVLAVLYRYAPDRAHARWRWISWGAGGATLLWLVTSFGLFAYVQQLGTYASTYGSLAGVAISMLWVWITVFLIVVGAAVNAEAERQTSRDSTVGPERPLGERGAVVADSAPPYPDASA